MDSRLGGVITLLWYKCLIIILFCTPETNKKIKNGGWYVLKAYTKHCYL